MLLAGYAEDKSDITAVPRHMYHWHIDTTAGLATIVNPLGGVKASVPLNPFVGCIGVCPANGQFVSSLHCGPHGGNLDLPTIRSRTTVYLPVNRVGALLMMGDIHAAQGDGEIIGGGIETSGKIACTIRIIKNNPMPACVLRDSQSVSVIGTHDELRQSIQQACGNLVNWLAQSETLNRFDLYNLVSQTVKITVGNLNKPPFPSAASVKFADLPTPLVEAIQQWAAN
jgi:acetamidase/formamidase